MVTSETKPSVPVLVLGDQSVSLHLSLRRLRLAKKDGVNLDPSESDQFNALVTNPFKVVETTWGLFKDRLQEAGIESEEQLEDLIDADLFDQLYRYYTESCSKFFMMARCALKQQEKLIERAIEKLTCETESRVSGQSSGELPESSESTSPNPVAT